MRLLQVAIPIRVLHVFGVKTIFVTNAAGGINRDFSVGDIMVISDHVNVAGFAGMNPLVGLNDDRYDSWVIQKPDVQNTQACFNRPLI